MTEVWLVSLLPHVGISGLYNIRSVPYVGTVVNGILNSGRVKVGDPILIGPDSNGNFMSSAVKSMQRKRFDSYSLSFSSIF